jgi:curved DNA-binding protein CbpA
VAQGSDPYAVLGVPRDATDSRIAQARRRLSRVYHPDVNSDPDAAARFDEVQQAFSLLSDAAARAEYDRAGGPAQTARAKRAARDRDAATEAAPGIFIQPASVDFGLIEPGRPYADAKVSVAWTGARPGQITSKAGGEWWTNLGSEMPAPSCIVFYLRALPQAGVPNGRRHAQFALTLDDTPLAVPLTAQIQGEFPPASPVAAAATGRVLPGWQLWTVLGLFVACTVLVVFIYSH